jgi:alcohol dehydrogenase class IV
MTLSYEFTAPRRIVFGSGRRKDLGTLVAPLGRRVFLLPGSRALEQNGELASAIDRLQRADLEVLRLETITREPTVADVDRTVAEIRGHNPQQTDVLLALGGGSAIDLAKAAAAVVAHPEAEGVSCFLEGVPHKRDITREVLPIVAVPTTAGTGSEATRNGVVSSPEQRAKRSIRSERLLPRLVVVDPELTLSLPPAVTAATGLDAITQLIESYISRRATPLSRMLVHQGLPGTCEALRTACRDGSHLPSREILAQAALLSGLALANSGLGLAHGVAAALGVHADVSHGLACAVMLPAALRYNLDCKTDDLATLSWLLLGPSAESPRQAAQRLIDTLEILLLELQVPRQLRDLGVRHEQLPDLVRDSRGNSLSGNPRDVSDAELREVLETVW